MQSTAKLLNEAHQAIVNVFLELDLVDYLSSEEIQEIFISQLGVSVQVAVDDIAKAFRSKGELVIDTRRETKANIRYYAKHDQNMKHYLLSERSAL